jgi:hypothetical protein
LQAIDPLCGELEPHVEVEGLDNPALCEVLLVSNVVSLGHTSEPVVV